MTNPHTERSIQEVAKAAGTTSRTLRHYDAIGLVKPSRIGINGYRYYDDRALVRLQRVLLLRELGLGLDTIGRVLEAQDREALPGEEPGAGEARILRSHLTYLTQERGRIDAQIAAVDRTITALEGQQNGDLMSENMFDGFDHTQYRDEVEQRWGADAYAQADSWWRGLGEEGQAAWKARVDELNRAWIAVAKAEDPSSPVAQDLARRHVEWLSAAAGTPAAGNPSNATLADYVTGLGEMYVADERFAANYGGTAGAAFVRDALTLYVERELRS